MIEGWEEYSLEDCCNDFSMGPFGSNIKAENFQPIGVPVIRGTNMNFPKYVDGEFVYLSDQKADELGRSNCFPGDLVFTHRGTIGQVALIPDSTYPRYVISQSGMRASPDKAKLDSDFLFYFFRSPMGQHELLQNESQVGVPSISSPLSSLKAVRLLKPPLVEQKAIAEVLSSLDDKIDLLHRQNATLEALAETLFRHAFIEEAPDDWEEEPLDQVANYLNGLACQKYPATNPVERLPVLKIKDLKNGLSTSSDWATSKVPPEYIVENGDIIFSWSASLLVKIWDGPKCVLNQHLFKVTSDRFPDWFIYQWTKHHLDRFIAIAETKATTMGHIKRTDLAAARVKVPDEQSLADAEETFAPIHQKIIANNRQIATLTEKRDELLPKLMSGEVRVKFEAADA